MTDASRARPVGFVAAVQCAGIVLGTVLACAAGQTSPDRVSVAPEAAVLAGSELEYAESGGLAGRIHHARLVASGGRVDVEYRPAESRQAGIQRGTLEASRYIELWREAERIGIWGMTSARRSRGADLMESELKVRLDSKTHSVRWQPEGSGPPALAGANELGRRILAAAREATLLR
jgi:hypothetical protein